jgi:hypothetical protein
VKEPKGQFTDLHPFIRFIALAYDSAVSVVLLPVSKWREASER